MGITYAQAKKVNMGPVQSGGTYQEKFVTPTDVTQVITPDEGYDGLSKVTVGASSGTSLVLESLELQKMTDNGFMVDGKFELRDLVNYAKYNDGYFRDVKDIATYSTPVGYVFTEGDVSASREVTASYTEGSTKYASFNIIVRPKSYDFDKISDSMLLKAVLAADAGDYSMTETWKAGDERKCTLKNGVECTLQLRAAVRQQAGSSYPVYGRGVAENGHEILTSSSYGSIVTDRYISFLIAIKEAFPVSYRNTGVYSVQYGKAGNSASSTRYVDSEGKVKGLDGNDTYVVDLLPDPIQDAMLLCRNAHYNGYQSSSANRINTNWGRSYMLESWMGLFYGVLTFSNYGYQMSYMLSTSVNDRWFFYGDGSSADASRITWTSIYDGSDVDGIMTGGAYKASSNTNALLYGRNETVKKNSPYVLNVQPTVASDGLVTAAPSGYENYGAVFLGFI